jgi:hypothetical protein
MDIAQERVTKKFMKREILSFIRSVMLFVESLGASLNGISLSLICCLNS